MKIIGHRGAAGLAPENTLRAITHGLQYHVDEIEVDVRVTKDDVPVLIHDDFLRSAGGDKLEVEVSTFKQIKELDAQIATLAEAIELIDRRVPLFLDIKPDVYTQPILNVLDQFFAKGWTADDFVISSKDYFLLEGLHRAIPEVTKCVQEPWSSLRAVVRAKRVGTKRLSMNHTFLWSGFVKHMDRRGWLVSAYTVNNPRRVRTWKKHGLYGVFTDRPDLLSDIH